MTTPGRSRGRRARPTATPSWRRSSPRRTRRKPSVSTRSGPRTAIAPSTSASAWPNWCCDCIRAAPPLIRAQASGLTGLGASSGLTAFSAALLKVGVWPASGAAEPPAPALELPCGNSWCGGPAASIPGLVTVPTTPGPGAPSLFFHCPGGVPGGFFLRAGPAGMLVGLDTGMPGAPGYSAPLLPLLGLLGLASPTWFGLSGGFSNPPGGGTIPPVVLSSGFGRPQLSGGCCFSHSQVLLAGVCGRTPGSIGNVWSDLCSQADLPPVGGGIAGDPGKRGFGIPGGPCGP